MKVFLLVLGGIVAVLVLVVAMYFVLVEAGEVVVLKTGETETRLWIVDHDGYQWLRRGDGVTGWAADMGDEIEVTRGEVSGRYRPVLVEAGEDRDKVNELTLEKYGLSERYLWLLGLDPKTAVAIRLDPTD